MAKKNKQISDQNFCDWMVNQVPVFDRMIMEDIRPTDQWMLHVPASVKVGFWKKLWWLIHCLWIMIPWLFRRSTLIDYPVNTAEETQDRFRAVFPKTTEKRSKTHRSSKRKKKKK